MKFLFSPNGRTSRAGMWAFMGLYLALMIAAMGADRLFGTYDAELETGVFEVVIMLLLFWPSIAVSVKRFHDRNMTGWWYLFLTIAMIVAAAAGIAVGVFMSGMDSETIDALTDEEMIQVYWPAIVGVGLVLLYWFIVQGVLPGDKGPNKYGEDPLEK